MKVKKYLTFLLGAALIVGCGKKETDDEDEDSGISGSGGLSKDEIPESSTEVLDFALNSMNSLAIDVGSGLNLESSEHATISGCSEHGEPWDDSTSQRTLVSKGEFAYQTFYCQLKVNDSVETVLGALKQNRNILCDVERLIKEEGGELEFTAEGKEYSADITITKDCGWAQKTIDEMDGQKISATVTATSFSSGDWEKKLEIDSDMVGLTLMFTANSERVAFKKYDNWDNAERTERGDALPGLEANETGVTGDFVTIDIGADGVGTLRAELLGTYWSRRTRLFAKGDIDGATGEFESISEKTGIAANFSPSNGGDGDQVTGLYGEIATVVGTAEDGYAYKSVGYSCRSEDSCSVGADVTGATVSSDEAYCTTVSSNAESKSDCASDVTTLDFGTAAADFNFLTVGKFFDDQTETYDDIASWIKEAGTLSFSKDDVINKTAVLEK